MTQIDLIRCKQQIRHFYDEQPSLQHYLSKLTQMSRGEHKATCLEEFGSASAIQHFLLNPGDISFIQEQPVHGAATTGSEEQVATSTTQEVAAGMMPFAPGELKEYALIGMWIVIGIVLSIFFRKAVRYLLEFLYDVWNARRMVYMKVLLPRGDTKAARELQKELAKDMKEMISRMSQIYRGLHKLGHLSVKDNVLRWLFGKSKISFMLHYEHGLLYFIVGTYPEYKKILEGAISAQFADASIELIRKPDLFPREYDDIIPLQAVKSGYYPIRTYKQLEDDPLNNIIDSVGKISNEDTFSILLTIKPTGDAFNRGAQKLADALYRKDETVSGGSRFKKLLPRNMFNFLVNGPSERLIEKFSANKKQGDPIIRMVKAEEEARNVMAEEAGKQAYE